MASDHFEDMQLVLVEPEPLPPDVADALLLMLTSEALEED